MWNYYDNNLDCENDTNNFLDYNLLSAKLEGIYEEEPVQEQIKIRDNIAEYSNVLKTTREKLSKIEQNSIEKGEQFKALQQELKINKNN